MAENLENTLDGLPSWCAKYLDTRPRIKSRTDRSQTMSRTQELSNTVKAASIITAILLSGSGTYLLIGKSVQITVLETQQNESSTNVYQCEPCGPAHYQDYHQLCIFEALETSGQPDIILCCR